MLCLIFGSLIFFTPSKETELISIFLHWLQCVHVLQSSVSFMYVVVCGCVWLDLVVVPGKPEQL